MKFAHLAPFVLAALCTLPVAAQQPDSPQPQNPQQQPTQQPQAQAQSQAPTLSQKDLSPVTGELESKLDSKTAKPGDSVVLKTTAKTVMANGTVIPKGSRIMGHVTGVQQHGDQSPNGQVTLQFDQAQLKGGQDLPILSTLQSVSPAESNTDTGSAMPMPSAPATSSATPSGGTSGGGSMGSSGSSSAQASRPTTSSPGMAAGQSEAQPSGPAPGTEVARKGNIVIRTTSVPGLFVAANVDGMPFSNASGVLLCAKKDVHLDSGTKVELAVAETPAGGGR